MNNDDYYYSPEFVELLLQLLSGEVGIIAMATTYMLQAAADTDQRRKNALNRIARRKTRHVNIFGMILVNVYRYPNHDQDGHQEGALLGKHQNSRSERNHSQKWSIATKSIHHVNRHPSGFSSHPRKYLAADILAENYQISIYDTLQKLTLNPIFTYALKIAKNQLLEHRKELITLLQHA